MRYRNCRFCHQYALVELLIKYSVRHYGHAGCIIEMGEPVLQRMNYYSLGELPGFALQRAGLWELVRSLRAQKKPGGG